LEFPWISVLLEAFHCFLLLFSLLSYSLCQSTC
jgi:hypothetical protein